MMRKSRQFSIVVLASVLIALLLSSPFLWMILTHGGDRLPMNRVLPLVYNLSGNFIIAMILFQLNLTWKYRNLPVVGKLMKHWVFVLFLNIIIAVLIGYLIKELGGFRPPRPARIFMRFGAVINFSSLVAYVMLVSRLLEVLIKNQEVALENERLRSENLQNQFSALKSQLDPHFLFNSLNTVMELIEEDKTLAKDFVAKLSEVFRYMLNHSSKNLIALSDELRFVEDYVYLLQLRHSQLRFSTKLADDKISWYVPPMAIQLLVENAIKHNRS
ncbi:MAG: sensor histidine kinase, partial [Bacteroidota bacterium]